MSRPACRSEADWLASRRVTDQTDAASADRVWFRLIRLETRLRLAVAKRLRRIGLSVPQCDVLTTLSEREGLSQQELAERLYVTKGNISGLVDRLVVAGFVVRRAIAADRRAHALYLTPEGHRVATEGIAIQRRFVAETFGRLSPADLARFDALLVATRDFVRAVPEEADETADLELP